MSNLAPCVYQENCSGCQLWGIPSSLQLEQKKDHLQGLLQTAGLTPQIPIQIKETAASHLRNRLDFTWHEGRLGLYKKPTTERVILDIPYCEVLDPRLNEELQFLRSLPWKFTKASFRLRISPGHIFGLWIDAANTEIKEFLDEKNIAEALLKKGWIVEVGQKGKELVQVKDGFKLQVQKLRVWNESEFNGHKIPLYGIVSGFVQPSFSGQDLLRQSLHELLKGRSFKNCLEFGSGNGNWSFSLLDHCQKLIACELDATAVDGFEKTLGQYPEAQARIQILQGDFHQQKELKKDFDLAFVNPARSGLKDFAKELLKMPDLQKIVYISCYPESFIKDAKALKESFQLQEIHIVDQFPFTHHYEVIALFQRV